MSRQARQRFTLDEPDAMEDVAWARPQRALEKSGRDWRTQGIVAATVLWLLVIAGGMHVLWRYKSTPGAVGAAPLQWPQGTGIARIANRPMLVMLAHPYCPCTRASIGELAVLMSRLQGRVAAHVLFSMPGGNADSWRESDLWQSAAAIPGVTVSADHDGELAARFHATTSGQTIAYDAAGRLLFSGGITGARGHFGDNIGRDRLTATLTGAATDRRASPVFGCALHDSTPATNGTQGVP